MYDMLWNVQFNMVVLRKSMCNFIFLFYVLSFYFLKASRLQGLRFSYPYNEIFCIHFNWAYNFWSIFNQNSISRQPMFREGWCSNIAPCNLQIFDCRLYPGGGKFEPCLAGVGNLNQKCRPSRGSALDSIHQNHLGREGLRWNDGQLMTCYTKWKFNEATTTCRLIPMT